MSLVEMEVVLDYMLMNAVEIKWVACKARNSVLRCCSTTSIWSKEGIDSASQMIKSLELFDTNLYLVCGIILLSLKSVASLSFYTIFLKVGTVYGAIHAIWSHCTLYMSQILSVLSIHSGFSIFCW